MSAVRERWGIALLTVALLGLAACAQVTIHAGDGSVYQATRFGILSITPQPGTTAQIVDLEGIGLVGQNGSMTLGYASSSTALLPMDDCRVVVWVEQATSAPTTLATLLDGRPEICDVGPGTD